MMMILSLTASAELNLFVAGPLSLEGLSPQHFVFPLTLLKEKPPSWVQLDL